MYVVGWLFAVGCCKLWVCWLVGDCTLYACGFVAVWRCMREVAGCSLLFEYAEDDFIQRVYTVR